jgi:hypothetical protein
VRLRLTLWFVFAVVLIAIVGAAAMYTILSQQLKEDLDAPLAAAYPVEEVIAGARRRTGADRPDAGISRE